MKLIVKNVLTNQFIKSHHHKCLLTLLIRHSPMHIFLLIQFPNGTSHGILQEALPNCTRCHGPWRWLNCFSLFLRGISTYNWFFSLCSRFIFSCILIFLLYYRFQIGQQNGKSKIHDDLIACCWSEPTKDQHQYTG